jgi:VanZ family protein
MRVATIVGAMAVWAVADETHQAWIPGRSMESGDVGADVFGAVAGAVMASAVSGRDRLRLSSRGTPRREICLIESRDPSLGSGMTRT